jgi:hypothetical protein
MQLYVFPSIYYLGLGGVCEGEEFTPLLEGGQRLPK